MNELVITNYKNSIISAVYEDKKMIQVSAFRKSKPSCVGNIYVGRVDNIVKNINAAFVNISEHVSCYLDLSENVNPIFVKKQSQNKISIGDELIVQVTKDDVKTKAPVVSTSFSLTGKYVVLVHGGNGVQISKKITKKSERSLIKEKLDPFSEFGFGLVARTNILFAGENELKTELNQLIAEYKNISDKGVHQSKYTMLRQELPEYLVRLRDSREFSIEKVITNISGIAQTIEEFIKENPIKSSDGIPITLEYVPDANELVIRYKINHFMDKALHRVVYLNSGASIVIEPTEALTVIDVNSGKAISGKKITEETFLAINLEAAKEIAAQIRLRNLSGIILIDFINLSDPVNEDKLKENLRELFKKDSVPTEVVDITKLGLMEITRKKIYKTLVEQLSDEI